MTLYKIIESLKTTQGTKAKQAILDANKDNELLREYMKAVFDPAINYYQSKIPKYELTNFGYDFTIAAILHLQQNLSMRRVTGRDAVELLSTMLSTLAPEGRVLVEYIIKRQIAGSSVGETMVLNTWPELFFVPPYMRCASMDKKVRGYYASLPYFYVQTKRDGAFAYLQKTFKGVAKAITRQGSMYPTWFAEKMATGVPEGFVLVGEMEVYKSIGLGHYELLDRKTGNGVLNSVQQSEDNSEFGDYTFQYVAWDMLSEKEFKAGKSFIEQEGRFNDLSCVADAYDTPNISIVDNWKVTSIAEANEIHLKHTSKGLEGTVWKTPDGLWRDTSSGTKDAVKNKVKFQAEFLITGTYEGEGKAVGMLGGINYSTPCGKIAANVGTGFSDKQRKELWEIREELPGKVMTLEANDVIDSKDSDILSLSLAVFIEVRTDRKEADSFERVMEQLQAAKEGRS